jgi:D-glycero-alpha-D-manno-heptose 1-phosphate guanylyltransferase
MISANIDAVILAGGLGTRLSSVVADRQKVAAEVSGKPFIAILLRQLENAGFRRVILCTGYLAETVEQAVRRHAGTLEVVFSCENTPLGTGGAIRNALAYVNTEYFLAMNGDSYFGTDLQAFIADADDANAILLRHETDTARYGSVILDDAGKVTEFREKDSSAGPGLINAGIYLLKKATLSPCPVGQKFSLEKDIFPKLSASGKLSGCVSDGNFIDIGTPESYAAAAELFK